MKTPLKPVWVALFCFAGGAALADDKPMDALPYAPSLDVDGMDRNIDPCEDLYTYACGGWKKRNPIPPDQTAWSTYRKLYEGNQRFLWGILQDAARPAANRSPSAQKIGDYFSTCMDEDAVEKAGLAPLRGALARIDGLTERKTLASLVGDLHLSGRGGILFNIEVQQDAEDSTRVIAAIAAGGLGLPDRDYYVKKDDKSVETRARYVAHITKLLEVAGTPPARAQEDAAAVMRIETELAKASLTRVDKRDPHNIHHRTSTAKLKKLTPGFDWAAYFKATGLRVDPWLNVEEPNFMEELNARLDKESLVNLKAYLRAFVLASAAPYLSRDFVREDFEFNRKFLRGAETDRPRWKKCVAWVDRDLGEALGREFVARAFPQELKARTVHMTQQIEAAMKQRIDELDWMSPETKAQALAKLAAVRNKVGYPDVWRDYSALAIGRGGFYGNVEAAAVFESRRQAAKIGQPVDHSEWSMTAPTVNAYYDAQLNDINFPAGVLMPPLVDPKMDDAPNYGDTGGTIGHELTHGFDDEGRQFDAEGNLRDWWQKADAKKFEKRAQCIRDQYSGYTIVDDIMINGALTSGEDIADLGGQLLAWMAWQDETKALRLMERDGLTPEQRFFVGFAQWTCSNERPEQLRVNALTNPHSPPWARVNGVVVNMPQFATAFQCKAGAKLVKKPDDICRIW